MSLLTSDEREARRRSPGAVLGVGVVLVIVGLLCLALGRLQSEGGHHAWDPNAASPSSYRLRPGVTYQLSTPGGVQKLTADGVLGTGLDPQCTYTGANGVQRQLHIASTFTDTRDLTTFATFTVDALGDYTIACDRITDVFVDDAEGRSFDTAALLTIVASVLLAAGVAAAFSGGYRLRPVTPARRRDGWGPGGV